MALQEIAEELLATTSASRTTIRVDRPGAVFPVVAEALAPGVRSIKDETAMDLRGAATFEYLEREVRPLVQSDCLADPESAPPPELLDLYGVRAQVLAPLVRDGRLAGIVSVHYADGPREWGEEDVAAVERAAERALGELQRT